MQATQTGSMSATPGTPRNLPLSGKDVRDLAFIRNSPEALSALPENVDAESTDEDLIHALATKAKDELIEAIGVRAYSAMAKDDRDETDARRRRTRRRSRSAAYSG